MNMFKNGLVNEQQMNRQFKWLIEQIKCLKTTACACDFEETSLTYNEETGELKAIFVDGSEKVVTIVANSQYQLNETEYNYLTEVVENDTIGLILDAIAVPPTYVAPTNSISNVTQTIERGSTVSINITQTFTQNDAGVLVSQEIQKDNVQVSTTSSFSESLLANAPTTVYRGLVTYAEGLTKLNNLGIPDPTGKITAGTITSAVRTVTSVYPYFFGKSLTQPTANQSLINSGTKVVADSNGTITVNFNASGEFLWFAIPSTSTSKTKWYETPLNNGNIGGISNLFGDLELVEVDSPTALWNGVEYKFYISNYATTAGNMQLRNS